MSTALDFLRHPGQLPPPDQQQTSDTFGFKWSKVDTYTGPGMTELARDWLLEKYFGGEVAAMEALFQEGHTMLDAGCGGFYSAISLFGPLLGRVRLYGVDISESVDFARQNVASLNPTAVVQRADLASADFTPDFFDLIFSEGVLHHTHDPQAALTNLAKALKPGGRLLFYVYKVKAPIREFTDDFVRDQMAHLSPEEGWEAMKGITALGQALGQLKQDLTIPQDIDMLGIKAGTYDLQRFVFYHVLKCFYREDLNFDEMNHINFDWFAPSLCKRFTPEEVQAMCEVAGLQVLRSFVDGSGISIVATKA